MADIREILNALSADDRAMYTQHRNEMRRSYLLAHNETIGMDKWDAQDDRLLDYIDISLALLYDRAGRLATTKELIGDDKAKIETDIDSADINLKKIDSIIASKAQPNSAAAQGWPKS